MCCTLQTPLSRKYPLPQLLVSKKTESWQHNAGKTNEVPPTKSTTIKHSTIKVYAIQRHTGKQEETRTRLRWVEELGMQITNNNWESIHFNTHKRTISQFWKQYAWKVQWHYFNSSEQQARYDQSKNNGGTEERTHLLALHS